MHGTAERFEDRAQAGRQLAQALDVSFDVLLVRRLHVPGREDLPLGAVASTGGVVLDRRAAQELDLSLDALVGATAHDLDRQAPSWWVRQTMQRLVSELTRRPLDSWGREHQLSAAPLTARD